MKSLKLFLTALFGISILYADAQNTFPASGNVGIGTINPSGILHIEGGLEPRSVQTIFPGSYTTGTPVSGLRLSWYNDYWDLRAHRTGDAGIDAFSVARNGAEYFRIGKNGNVGIGTNNPLTSLQIGNFNNQGAINQLSIPGTYNFEQLRLGQIGNGNQALEFVNHTTTESSYGIRFMANVDQSTGLQIQYAVPATSYAALSYITGLFMNLTGNIGVGTLHPAEKLSVNGNIRAKEIKVEAANWPDYVFFEGYEPTSLADLEAFIKTNKHLPEIPSAKEAEEKGISLGEMNAKLLKKIEELTLHLIEKDKQLIRETSVNDKQQRELVELKEEMKRIKEMLVIK